MAFSLAHALLEGTRAPALRSYHVLVEGTGFELPVGYLGSLRRFSAWRCVQAADEGEARALARRKVAQEWADLGWARTLGQATLATPVVSCLSRIGRWAARDTPLEFSSHR